MERAILIKPEDWYDMWGWEGSYLLTSIIFGLPILIFIFVYHMKVSEFLPYVFIAYICFYVCLLILAKKNNEFGKFIMFFGVDKYMYFARDYVEIKSGNLFNVTKIPYRTIRSFELQTYDRHQHGNIVGHAIHKVASNGHERMDGNKLLFYGEGKEMIYEAELLYYSEKQREQLLFLLKSHVS